MPRKQAKGILEFTHRLELKKSRRNEMTIEELEARLSFLENQYRISQDIAEIERLQKAYGYYIEHWMSQELIDLFADGLEVALHLVGLGIYKGKDHVSMFFKNDMGKNPEFIHQVMQTSGIVTVDPDGQSAKGRWNGWGVLVIPQGDGVTQEFLGGMYENDYIKQNGKWMIKVARHIPTYYARPGQGIVKPERATIKNTGKTSEVHLQPDILDTVKPVYPSDFIFPFHFRHPVTGQETSEKQRFSKSASLE
jgi:hypothetical protein